MWDLRDQTDQGSNSCFLTGRRILNYGTTREVPWLFFCLKIFRCIVLSVTLPSTEASFVAQTVKLLTTMRETRIWYLFQEDPMEKEMATHSSILAWKIPWTEEPGRLQSMGSKRVGHDWATSLLHFFAFCIPTVFLPRRCETSHLHCGQQDLDSRSSPFFRPLYSI